MEYATIKSDLVGELKLKINGKISTEELLRNHTYFKIGGLAEIFAEPKDIEDLINIFELIRKYKVKYYIIGNGTNLLFADEGFEGLIVKIGENFNQISVEGNKITAGAGALLSVLSKTAAKKSMTGLEFASGIPGYVGGAVCMNAGAYGGEIKDVVERVKCIDSDGNIHEFSKEQMKFDYRCSKVTDTDLVVIESTFVLKEGNQEEISNRMKDLNDMRISKQPVNFPSAGSTFKRPATGYASKLIEDAGLKGMIYRGAMVSDKHSGFVININDATCDDVIQLMKIIISTVKDKFDITLEPEVKIIGTTL